MKMAFVNVMFAGFKNADFCATLTTHFFIFLGMLRQCRLVQSKLEAGRLSLNIFEPIKRVPWLISSPHAFSGSKATVPRELGYVRASEHLTSCLRLGP